MKTLTSAAANKLLKSLNDEKTYLLSLETSSYMYVLSDDEEIEKPAYDYEAVQQKLFNIDRQVRILKHALNIFNTTTLLEEVNLTIDEALIEMAQLNSMKLKLDNMRKQLPKSRVSMGHFRANAIIEYQYVNYDLEKVQADYKAVCERISAIQMALDLANQTKCFSVEELQ